MFISTILILLNANLIQYFCCEAQNYKIFLLNFKIQVAAFVHHVHTILTTWYIIDLCATSQIVQSVDKSTQCGNSNQILREINFRQWNWNLKSSLCMVLKFQGFSATLILREINFRDYLLFKNCQFCNLWGSEFQLWWFLVIFECWNLLKIKIQSLCIHYV